MLPSAVTPADIAREQLHVALLSAGSFTQKLSVTECPTFESTAREEKERISSVDGEFILEQSDIPSVSEFCVSAWLDVNRNGSIDAGDAMGQLAKPYPVMPSTFFGSNVYESPPVMLETLK